MHEMLKGMKVIKFYAYERYFSNQISQIRQTELKEIKKMAYLKEINTTVALSTPTLMSISTFVMYGLIATFNPAIAFTVLALFSSLRVSIRFLPQVINTLAECKTSIKRMESLLASEEVDEELPTSGQLPDNVAVRVQHADFTWGNHDETATLKDMDFEILKGELIAIVGSVGKLYF
jgi:ABC-type multidrug transport system fused ATPase/permease subunit